MRRRTKRGFTAIFYRIGHTAKTPSVFFGSLVSLLITILIASSCARFTPRQTEEKISPFQGFCLEGSGKGRLTQHLSRKLFSYESKIDLEAPSWKLGIDIPLHGEEVIDLQFDKGEIILKGSFAQKLAKFSSKDKKLWLDMIEMLKHFLLSLKNPTTNGENVQLEQTNEFRLFTYKVNKSKMTLKLYGETSSTSEVNKVEFQYFPAVMSEKSALSLLLFTSECQNVLKMK